ncbi:hypothetical protein BDZ45DRAFT_795403 [Acephala macrosclerotiorum]|nr:hypothetical protein BDZ45DRAFT_795403 [Acephala macrosclerotiorum]
MAPHKHKHKHLQQKHIESHRSLVSFNFQSTHPPAHRESLVRLQHYTIVTAQSDHRDPDMRRDLDMGSRRDKLMTTRGIQRPSEHAGQEVYSGWMTKFCVEPIDDVNTCCLGCWVPCALFTKTHWRLGQVGRNENALHGWTSSMGCSLPCWAYCVLTLACRASGCLTGCQSTRIRGTYGIEGSMFKDMCRGYWCPQCAQMQNDREVQAREGVQGLRYNPKYLARKQNRPVDTQPPPHPPMSYAPTQSLERATQITQMAEVTSRGKKLQEPSPTVEVHVEAPQVEVYAPQPPGVKGGETSTQAEQHQQGWEKEKSGISANRKDYQRAKKRKQERKGHARLHSGAYAAISDVEASRKPGKNANFPGSSAKDNISDIRTKSDHERLSRRHPLSGCVGIETERKGKDRSEAKGHALVGCTIIEVDNGSHTSEHAVSDCTMTLTKSTDIEEQRRRTDCSGVTASDTQELSYVHDFTDCPVDKAVLNHLENQEKALQQHCLTNDSRGSLSPAGERRVQQHSLSQDRRRSSSTVEEEKVKQHSLAQDSRASTFTAEERKLKQHSLSHDSQATTLTLEEGKAKQHSLTDDSRGSSTTVVPSYSLFPQHASADYPGANEIRSSKLTARQHRSSTIDSSKSKKSGGLKEHRLDSCPIVVPSATEHHQVRGSDNSQHRLSKCLPTTPTSKNQQDAAHVHDESCLTESLHHRCSLNFEIPSANNSGHDNNGNAFPNTGTHVHDEKCLAKGSHHRCALNFETAPANNPVNDNNSSSSTGAHPPNTDDTTKAKDGTRQKQRRFKGSRKTNDPKISLSSYDNKSGRAAEKSTQSANSHASSSQGGKKENAQDSQGDTSDDVVGFPYSDIQETTKIIVSHTTQGE